LTDNYYHVAFALFCVRLCFCLLIDPVGAAVPVQRFKYISNDIVLSRLVVLESGIGLESGLKSIFAGLGLGLGKICNQVQFQFSLCTYAVFCFGRTTFCQPVSYTQPKISVTYLIFAAELTRGLACSDSIYIVLILIAAGTYTEIKNLDFDLELVDLDLDSESCSFSGLRLEASGLGVDLDLAVAGLDTSLVLLLTGLTHLHDLLAQRRCAILAILAITSQSTWLSAVQLIYRWVVFRVVTLTRPTVLVSSLAICDSSQSQIESRRISN